MAPGRRLGGHCRMGAMPLQLLPKGSGRCLDGTPAGYYLWKAEQDDRTLNYRTHWVVFLEGGGWCLSAEDCAIRSTTSAGSSRLWSELGSKGGILSRCCALTSMEFCNMNKVFVPYCDGASFGGARDIPLGRAGNVSLPTGVTPNVVRSDGRAILVGVIRHLITHHGMGNATDVLVSGCSAGGLAALLYGSLVRDELQQSGANLKRFKLASFSGLFFAPRHGLRTARQGPAHLTPFERQMRQVVELSNLSLPSTCQYRTVPGHEWRCLLGTAPLMAVPADIPVFVVQSTFDLFHTNCILGMPTDDRFGYGSRYFQAGCLSAGWERCLHWMTPAYTTTQFCSLRQLSDMESFQQHITSTLETSEGLQRRGSRAFLANCNDHCADANALQGTTIDGVTMMKALTSWWRAPAEVMPKTHLGCLLNFSHSRHRGPPSCTKPQATCGSPVRYKDPRKRIILSATRLESAMGRALGRRCSSDGLVEEDSTHGVMKCAGEEPPQKPSRQLLRREE